MSRHKYKVRQKKRQLHNKMKKEQKFIAAIEHERKDIFIESLKNMSEKDISSRTEKKINTADIARKFALLTCVAVFLYSGYSIVMMLFSYAQAAAVNDEIRNIYYEDESASGFTSVAKPVRNKTTVELLKYMVGEKDVTDTAAVAELSDGVSFLENLRYKMEKLEHVNPDTYGWITVGGTKIDFPVVQSSDNEYYLEHTFTKVYNKSGAIFADYKLYKNVEKNRNTIIYGHNMADGSMFEDLLKFRRNKNLFNDSVIVLETKYGIFSYEVFSVYIAPVSNIKFMKVAFASDEEWVNFLYEMESFSIYHKEDIKFNKDDRLITLQTCTNRWDNSKFIVQGRLIEIKR